MAPRPTHDLGISTADVSNLTHTKIPTTSLLSIPREIRDKIFAPLLHAGDLAILRTSIQIHHEAKERLYREGVFRIKMGFPDCRGGDSPFPETWKQFQNFHVRIYAGSSNRLSTYINSPRLDSFANLDEINRKRECLITVEERDPLEYRPMLWIILPQEMACLKTVASVVVMFMPNQPELWRFDSAGVNSWNSMNKWECLKRMLEPELGPAKLDGAADHEVQRLVFHPQEYRSSLARM